MRLWHLCSGACMGAAILLGATSAGAVPYEYTNLTSSNDTTLLGINTSGTIIGQSGANYPSFIYANGTYTTLNDPLARSGSTFASGINDAGVVVGSYATGDAGHGFIYSNGVFTTFDVPGALDSYLVGINDVGTMWGSDDNNIFVVQNGVISTLTLPYTGVVSVVGINDSGVIAGSYPDSAGASHGYVDTNGVYTTIDVPGADDTFLTGINDTGELVGYYFAGQGEGSFAYQNDIFTPIVDPNEIVAAGINANAISNSGVIVGNYIGFGRFTPEEFGFIATPTRAPEPVPEPLTLSLFAAGLFGAVAMRNRKKARR